MITIKLKTCKSCAWLKMENGEVMCRCQLKGLDVYVNSVACSDWSEIGLL